MKRTRIADPELRRIAGWYPTNREAREAIERIEARYATLKTLEQRNNADTSIANLRRVIELREGQP